MWSMLKIQGLVSILNAVAGRGVGCGRIPEHRLLMDQLVPASYLQLEDTVRNISLIMRLQGKPPVLTYKDLRYAIRIVSRNIDLNKLCNIIIV